MNQSKYDRQTNRSALKINIKITAPKRRQKGITWSCIILYVKVMVFGKEKPSVEQELDRMNLKDMDIFSETNKKLYWMLAIFLWFVRIICFGAGFFKAWVPPFCQLGCLQYQWRATECYSIYEIRWNGLTLFFALVTLFSLHSSSIFPLFPINMSNSGNKKKIGRSIRRYGLVCISVHTQSRSFITETSISSEWFGVKLVKFEVSTKSS